MTDSKLTALTENTDPQGTDILYLVDDPGGTPLSQKLTVTNLFTNPVVSGNLTVAQIIKPDGDATDSLKLTNAGETYDLLVLDTTNNRIGVGTNAPSQDLHLYKAGNATMQFEGSTGSRFYLKRGTNAGQQGILIQTSTNTRWALMCTYSGEGAGEDLYIAKNGSTVAAGHVLYVQRSTGNIAIGGHTETPSAALDVGGDFVASGIADITVQHGHLYTGGGSGTQTPNTSYALMNQWLSAGSSSSGVTPDTANDKITVTDTGIYLVTCSLSFTGTNSSTVTGAIFWNGVEQPITFQRKLGTGSDVGNANMMGIIDVTTGSTDIDMRVKCDGASDVFDLKEGQLTVVRIGAT